MDCLGHWLVDVDIQDVGSLEQLTASPDGS